MITGSPLFESEKNDRPGWVLAGFFLFLLLSILFALRVRGQTADDFFITYRYAHNLVSGAGFVFNPGEWVLGTTAPGWGLVLALLHLSTGVSIPDLGSWTTGIFLAMIAGLLLREGAKIRRAPEAFVAGLLLVTSVFFWSHNGFELYGVILALLVVSQTLITRPAWAGALAGFAVWGRPDVGPAAVALAALLVSGSHWRAMRWYLVALASVVGVGLLVAQVYYGSPLPGTLAAKRLQASWLPDIWPSGRYFWLEGVSWARDAFAGSRLPWLLALGLPGWVMLFRLRSPGFLVLALQAAVTLVAYPLLGVPFYTWYAIPVLMALLYGAAFAVGSVVRWLLSRGKSWRSPSLWAALVLGLVALPLPVELITRTTTSYLGFQGMPRHDLYRRAGLWLAENTSAEATIAFVEVGTVAFYSRRSVRDLLGLVSPRALPCVARRDLEPCLRDDPTDYFLTTTRLAGLLESITTARWFGETYQPVAEIRGHTETLMIYSRLGGHGQTAEMMRRAADQETKHAVVSFL